MPGTQLVDAQRLDLAHWVLSDRVLIRQPLEEAPQAVDVRLHTVVLEVSLVHQIRDVLSQIIRRDLLHRLLAPADEHLEPLTVALQRPGTTAVDALRREESVNTPRQIAPLIHLGRHNLVVMQYFRDLARTFGH